MEHLKSPTGDSLPAKKLYFKVFRDKARLFALKRDETNAHSAHKKAEKILNEELIPAYTNRKSLNQSMRVDASIKNAKLQLLKGLWISKFGFEKSIQELMEAYFRFSDAVGDEKNYFGANSFLEIGSNYMRLKNYSDATSYLSQAVQIFEHLFGEEHPIIQKYYNYSADVFSYAEDNESMLSMAYKNLDVVERNNVAEDGSQSLFILDALLQVVSMVCQASKEDARKDEIESIISRMETICAENGIIDGCQLLHAAYTLKSMTLLRKEKIREALAILEETYEKQVKKLKGEEAHPFLEQCISQMGLL